MNSKISTIAGGVFGVFVLGIVTIFIISYLKPKTSPHMNGPAWNENMLVGATNAPNKIVEYSDYFCSHCAEFHHSAGN